MKRFKVEKAYLVFMFILSVFIILPGCSGGVFGGGHWDKPVTVSSTDPANGAAGVFVNTRISATFSGDMDPATLTTTTFTVMQGATAVPGTVTYTGVTAVFTPMAVLAPNTVYIGTITTGAKDHSANRLAADYVWSFTTGARADTTAPTVTGTVNANGATNVAINTRIGATFSEAMDPATVTGATFTLRETVAGTAVAGGVTYSGVSAAFAPSANLAPSTRYTVTIKGGVNGAKDLAGNPMVNDYVWSWTTAATGAALDTTSPTVTLTVPANAAVGVLTNSKVSATFSEAMDPLTITNLIFTVKQGATPVSGTVIYSGVTGVFTPTTALAASTTYTATISTAAKDMAGNALASNYVWSFTTGAALDTTRPTVTITAPADAAVGVLTNATISANFSEPMDPLTITNLVFTVKQGVTPVPGAVVYSGATAVFTPAAELAAGTTYTAAISAVAEDLAGNALASGLVPNPWTFTTAAIVIPPVIPPSALGSAAAFGIMATSAITNTGAATRINGDVSLEPGTSNGLLPVQVNGTIHINDTVSHQARADLLAAYNTYKSLPPGTTVSGGADLGALYPGPAGIPPGTYTSGSTMLVSTPLILNAGGNANAVWVFQIGSSLTTTANVVLANGAQAKNVFWVPTLDGTVGVGSTFYGTIISGRDVNAKTGAVINGRILAGATLAGTIALDTNTVNVPAP